MIVRATSDLHLKNTTANYVFAALEELRIDADKHGGVTVLVGDIFDQPHTVHMPTFNALRDLLQTFKGEVFVIAGNHDQYSGSRNVLEALEGGNVQVISAPTETAYGLMVPYLPPEDFWKAVKKLKPASIWWTHQGWKGSYLNNMRRDRDGLSPKMTKGVLVISGHYHMPQNLGKIIYCGSPYQVSFAEEGQQKGWLRWEEFDATKPSPPSRIPYTFDSPQYHTVFWDLEKAPVRPKEAKAGDRIRVIVSGTRADAKKKASELKKARLDGAAIVAKQASGSQRTVIDSQASTKEAVHQFIDRVFGPSPEHIEPSKLLNWAEEAELWR